MFVATRRPGQSPPLGPAITACGQPTGRRRVPERAFARSDTRADAAQR
jgi:hypothetical protein